MGRAGGGGAGAAWTHLRLNIYPDGGVARFRAYGEVVVDWTRVARAGRAVDLASIRNGGLVLGASDMHFGATHNMIMPGRAQEHGRRLGDAPAARTGPRLGDCPARRAGPADPGRDRHESFQGQLPGQRVARGLPARTRTPLQRWTRPAWFPILPQTKLRADHRHVFSSGLRSGAAVSHVRLNIIPDGGISRLRIYGTVAPA